MVLDLPGGREDYHGISDHPTLDTADLLPEPEPRSAPLASSPHSKVVRRFRAAAATAGVLALAAALVVFALPQHSADHVATSSVEPVQQWGTPLAAPPPPVQSRNWLMCAGMGRCGTNGYQRFLYDPKVLVHSVGTLTQVPGITNSHFEPVATKWIYDPPEFNGRRVQLQEIADFVKMLLGSDPFGTGQMVPYVDLGSRGGDGVKAVAISQKQLAFIVANVLMGNTIDVGDGLTAAFKRCSARATTGFVFSVLSLLAVLSQELVGGQQGHMLIGATPGNENFQWKQRLSSHTLEEPTLCQKGRCDIPDFMAGGRPKQALTDIAGRVVGGGGDLCDTANTQDESLVQFYSEVLAFAFFAARGKMLMVPFTLLGARRYVGNITGESGADNRCGRIAERNWLNREISKVTVTAAVNGVPMTLAANAFVALRSKCSTCGGGCPAWMARNNQCDIQRRHADADISRWFQAFEPTMYEPAIREAFVGVIQRIGTGPWGAGAWYGDCQQYFLIVWLATNLLSGAYLDYYLYDHFCENPGNQCFLYGSSRCSSCLASSGVGGLNAKRCGKVGIHSIVQRFQGRSAMDLYRALNSVGPPPSQVFDLLANA